MNEKKILQIECETIKKAKNYIKENQIYPDVIIINGKPHYKTENYIKIDDRLSYYYEYELDDLIKNNDWTIRKMRINL